MTECPIVIGLYGGVRRDIGEGGLNLSNRERQRASDRFTFDEKLTHAVIAPLLHGRGAVAVWFRVDLAVLLGDGYGFRVHRSARHA